MLCSSCEREEWENKKENSTGTNESEEGRGRDVRGTGAEDHEDNHAVPLQPMEDSMPQQVDMSWRKLKPVERRPRWSRLSVKLTGRNCGPWGTHTGAVCFWRTAPHEKDLCQSSFWRTAAQGKGPHWSSSWRAACMKENIPGWSRGRRSRGKMLWVDIPVCHDLDVPALAGGLDWIIFWGPFQHLMFCDSVWFYVSPIPHPYPLFFFKFSLPYQLSINEINLN